MKKSILFIACTIIMTIFLTSCETKKTTTTYPDNLIGFWLGSTGNMDKWYGLDVLDTQNATLITYYSQDDPEGQNVSITYDATTGKGKLMGDGATYQLKATSDSTLTIVMVEGTVVFTRSVRPKETINMVGYWKSNRVDDIGLDLLVYPTDEWGITQVTIINVDETFDETIGEMASLMYFNAETGDGTIKTKYSTKDFNVVVGTNPAKLILKDYDIEYTLTKQEKANNAPNSIIGEWSASIPALLSIAIQVKDDNTCDIQYSILNPETQETKTGTAHGTTFYCPRAGMGAVVPNNLEDHPELIELVGKDACGIFVTTSYTTAKVSFRGLTLVFNKK